MELHLVNGFLGSGKTTAIITATQYLIQHGKRVGIVTNDKGRFQVDTAFFRSSHIPTQQVTGGCFRCSYSEFEDRILELQESTVLDVIFAESVGSCVDLVNTIFGPIHRNQRLQIGKTTYSVFSDIRLFRRWILEEPLPFSETITYLFEKQIEESQLVILNKSDLFSPAQQKEVLDLATLKFPEKNILLQNSLDPSGVLPWLQELEKEDEADLLRDFSVDYPRYKTGEKEMAWVDYQFTIESNTPELIKPALVEIIHSLLANLQRGHVFVGHIKFFFSSPEAGTKLSFTTADFLPPKISSDWAQNLPDVKEETLAVMLNARVGMTANEFLAVVEKAVHHSDLSPFIRIRIERGSAYNPEMSMDRPT